MAKNRSKILLFFYSIYIKRSEKLKGLICFCGFYGLDALRPHDTIRESE